MDGIKLKCGDCRRKRPVESGRSWAVQTEEEFSQPDSQSQHPDPIPISDLAPRRGPSSGSSPVPVAPSHQPGPSSGGFSLCHGVHDDLSNFSAHKIVYKGVVYCSIEQAYHHIRAIVDNQPDLAKQIIEAKSPYEIKFLSHRITKRLPDSQEIDDDVNLMRSLLQAKSRQCPAFREKLRQTRNSTIVHSTKKNDTFWATGLHYTDTNFSNGFPGKNMHGVLLMEVRGAMKQESEYPAVLQVSSDATGNTPPTPLCFHCGVPGHVTRKCWHIKRTVYCHGCGAAGHKQRYCPMVGPIEVPSYATGVQRVVPEIPLAMKERGYGAHCPLRQKRPLMQSPIPVYANNFVNNHYNVPGGSFNANAAVFNPGYPYTPDVNVYPALNRSP